MRGHELIVKIRLEDFEQYSYTSTYGWQPVFLFNT